MCDLLDSQQPAEKLSRMKKLRRTLSESFGRLALNKDDNGFDEATESWLKISLLYKEKANKFGSPVPVPVPIP